MDIEPKTRKKMPCFSYKVRLLIKTYEKSIVQCLQN